MLTHTHSLYILCSPGRVRILRMLFQRWDCKITLRDDGGSYPPHLFTYLFNRMSIFFANFWKNSREYCEKYGKISMEHRKSNRKLTPYIFPAGEWWILCRIGFSYTQPTLPLSGKHTFMCTTVREYACNICYSGPQFFCCQTYSFNLKQFYYLWSHIIYDFSLCEKKTKPNSLYSFLISL